MAITTILRRDPRFWMLTLLCLLLASAVGWIIFVAVTSGPVRVRADAPEDQLAAEIFSAVREDQRFVAVEVRRSLSGEGLEVVGEVPTRADAEALRTLVGGRAGETPVRYEVYPTR